MSTSTAITAARKRVEREDSSFELCRELLSSLGVNQGKIERLKDVTASSHSSIVSAENLLSFLSPEETERKCNVDQWFKKVRKVLLGFMSRLSDKHESASCDIATMAHFLQSIHPPVFLDRPPAQSQAELPDDKRCIALCFKNARCFRQRYKQEGFLCTTHLHHLPFGVVEEHRANFLASSPPAFFDLPLRLVNYRGFYVYVDLVNNNVYSMEDIYRKSTAPRILGKYSVETDPETLEEKYIIPVLDSA